MALNGNGWNGNVLTLVGENFTTTTAGLLTPTNLSMTGTTGKSLIITGWDLWCDSAAVGAFFRMGYADDGGTNATYLTAGYCGEPAGVAGLKFHWSVNCFHRPIALASGKGLQIASSNSAVTISGTVWVHRI